MATDGEFVTDGHLGGYVAGGDPATVYPDLWDWLVATLGKRVLDVGCGDGVAVRHFEGLGCEVVGIDGVPQENPRIAPHDFTTGPWQPPLRWTLANGPVFDFVWSCEFVEHVEERYLPNFLAAFQTARFVLLTHADEGQPGHHHVNCKPANYWTGALAAIGFSLDPRLTEVTRQIAGRNAHPLNHYVRSGLAFAKSG